MRIHELKCHTDYFEDLITGEKTFEVRKDDRFFEVGDYLALNEVQAEGLCVSEELLYTGRCCLVSISYILADSEYCKDGYVILGIRPCRVSQIDHAQRLGGISSVYGVPLCGGPSPGVGGNG